MSKPRVIKDYDKMDETIIAQIKLNYPHGFEKSLIRFRDPKGKFISALPFEAEDRYYLIRMTAGEAQQIIKDDDDYDDQGQLKSDAIEELTADLDITELPEEARPNIEDDLE